MRRLKDNVCKFERAGRVVDDDLLLHSGDAERDVTAGIAAGMRTIVACYGYIEAHESPANWPADGHIHEPSALLDWLPS